MTTLHHLNLALIDVHERLTRELQFSTDAERQIMEAFHTADDALHHLERTIKSAFGERSRALSAAIGSGKPSPETVEHEGELPIRKAKAVILEAADAE